MSHSTSKYQLVTAQLKKHHSLLAHYLSGVAVSQCVKTAITNTTLVYINVLVNPEGLNVLILIAHVRNLTI